MPNSQIPFVFPSLPDFSFDSFLVSNSNKEAFQWIQAWPEWKVPFVLFWGPKGSGKTHLLHLWLEKTSGILLTLNQLNNFMTKEYQKTPQCIAIDDINCVIDEEAFFHFYNYCQNNNCLLLITSEKNVDTWDIRLPDLKSRLSTFARVFLDSPDDAVLTRVFHKLCAEKGLIVGDEIINYVMTRSERSFEAINKLVHTLDQESIRHQKKLTIPFIKQFI